MVADEQVSVTIVGDVEGGPPSPMREDLMTAVSAVTNTLWPGVPAVPMMVMGATDGMYLRAAGIPTYGVQGFFYDRDDIRFHGRDERAEGAVVLRRADVPVRAGEAGGVRALTAARGDSGRGHFGV